MYKVVKADKDAYIANRVINNSRTNTSNVGSAGSLDLFKLYGYTSTGSNPNIELSRLLIHYDLQPIRDLVSAGKIDPGNASFNCTLKLFDVYGGQPTPANFEVTVHPLSRSFDEGLGRDVVYYADRDTCNFLTGSRTQGPWLLSGCALGGGLPGSVDYVTASSAIEGGISLKSSQTFITGEEDLEVDVTRIVSATLAGLLPDEGFRIALSDAIENNQHSYFVKRFAARKAYNSDKHPAMIVRYDDSIQDDSLSLTLDSPSNLFLFNYATQSPANLTSGSTLTQIVGPNSLILKLATEISGGWYTLTFTGSQHTNGIFAATGIYSASVLLPSTDTILASKLAQSGSIKFTPIWGSIDETVTYLTGSTLTVRPATRSSSIIDRQKLIVSIHNVQDRYFGDEETILRVHIFDASGPAVIASRLPVELPGGVFRDVHYQIRDDNKGAVVVPFDTQFNSTRLSSDTKGMYLKLDTSNLTHERSYVIDILVVTENNRQVYKSASPVFRVSNLR